MVKDKAVAKILLEWNCQDEHVILTSSIIPKKSPLGLGLDLLFDLVKFVRKYSRNRVRVVLLIGLRSPFKINPDVRRVKCQLSHRPVIVPNFLPTLFSSKREMAHSLDHQDSS
jgi:hypothetical protein